MSSTIVRVCEGRVEFLKCNIASGTKADSDAFKTMSSHAKDFMISKVRGMKQIGCDDATEIMKVLNSSPLLEPDVKSIIDVLNCRVVEDVEPPQSNKTQVHNYPQNYLKESSWNFLHSAKSKGDCLDHLAHFCLSIGMPNPSETTCGRLCTIMLTARGLRPGPSNLEDLRDFKRILRNIISTTGCQSCNERADDQPIDII